MATFEKFLADMNTPFAKDDLKLVHEWAENITGPLSKMVALMHEEAVLRRTIVSAYLKGLRAKGE